MAQLDLFWNYDKIANDPLASGKLFYRKPYKNGVPILIGQVSEIAPKFAVDHEWTSTEGGNGIADVISSAASYLNNVFKSLTSFAQGAEALVTGKSKFTSNKFANIVNGDLNNKFKQYSGSSYEITLPTLTINLLPTDRPESSEITVDQTPAGKLSKLLTYRVSEGSNSASDGNTYDSSDKVGPKLSQDIENAKTQSINEANSSSSNQNTVANNDKSPLKKLTQYFDSLLKIIKDSGSRTQAELDKLNDTKFIGSSAYLRNQILSIAPVNFYRMFDYSYPIYLQGTLSLVINKVIYRNLLIKSINTECSKTRLFNGNNDLGPSWIKIDMSFQPAIDWTVRDIEDLILQLVNNGVS